MATQKKPLAHSADTRQKIQTTYLINRLTQHVKGEVALSPTQVNSIKILLDKSLPDLSDVKIDTGAGGITFNLNTTVPPKK